MFDVMSFPAILSGIGHHFKFCWYLHWMVWLFVCDSTRWISKADYFLFPVFIQLNILNIIITTVLRYDLITVNKVNLTNTNTVNRCIIHEELSNWFPAQWWVSYRPLIARRCQTTFFPKLTFLHKFIQFYSIFIL